MDFHHHPAPRRFGLTLFAAAIALTMAAAAAPVFAGAGIAPHGAPHAGTLPAVALKPGLLPARAEPRGHSLAELAGLTAAFNVGDHSGAPPPLVDGSSASSFQMLYTTATNSFDVKPGTTLYVPVIFNDDSPPIIGSFPNIADRAAVLRYFYSGKQFGLQYATITIDGQEFPLNETYLVTADVPPLPDGGGTHYMADAAFVKPLPTGSHVVEIAASATGDAVAAWCQIVGFCTTSLTFTVAYTVNVK